MRGLDLGSSARFCLIIKY